jgi:hypothetical protein
MLENISLQKSSNEEFQLVIELHMVTGENIQKALCKHLILYIKEKRGLVYVTR